MLVSLMSVVLENVSVYPMASVGVVDVSDFIHVSCRYTLQMFIYFMVYMYVTLKNHLLFVLGVIYDHSFMSLMTATFRAKLK